MYVILFCLFDLVTFRFHTYVKVGFFYRFNDGAKTNNLNATALLLLARSHFNFQILKEMNIEIRKLSVSNDKIIRCKVKII